MSIEFSDGTVTSINRLIPETSVEVPYVTIAIISRRDFAKCPICLEPNPTSEEHVPPRALGGSVLTLTCSRRNNDLGSKVEVHLIDWFDDAFHVRFASDDVRGDRRSPRILMRQHDDGSPAFIIDSGRLDPEISRMFEAGDFSMLVRSDDPTRVRIAALKSVYLAACILHGDIINTPRAEQIREILLQARDLPRDAALPMHPILEDLRLMRTYKQGTSEVALMARQTPEGLQDLIISLARVVGVSWPLEPINFVEPDDAIT